MALFDEIHENLVSENQDLFLERTIEVDKKNGMSVYCKQSDTRISGKDAYFKVYNSAEHSSATKVTRVCFYTPKYIMHRDPERKENWTLKAKEKKQLMDLLNKKSRNKNFDRVWDELIFEYNKCNPADRIDSSIPIPDYTKLP